MKSMLEWVEHENCAFLILWSSVWIHNVIVRMIDLTMMPTTNGGNTYLGKVAKDNGGGQGHRV